MFVSITNRPTGAQAWPGFIESAQKGNSKFQLGKGENLMDWTYVDNVAHAHLLAADKLTEGNNDVAGQVRRTTIEFSKDANSYPHRPSL